MTDLWDGIRERLAESGIDLNIVTDQEGGARVVCVCGDLRDSVANLGMTSRDQVVMVRVDDETRGSLDAWVETGAVKSRSEAAALFIREGLQIRAKELEELDEALQSVEAAKQRLREKAREVIGDEPAADRETESD